MQIPIPDDWNGQDWQCVQVEFPDSPLWTAILMGLLSYATRARVWDGKSGSILDVQAIGREIWDRNYPLVPCADCDTETEPGDSDNGTEPIEITGELCMNGCSIPYGALRWQDGKLQFRYCGEWYDVGGDVTTPTFPDEPDIDIVPDPPPTGWEDSTPCAKARALAVMTYNIVVQGFAEDEGVEDPWEFYNDMNDAFRTIDLAFNDMMSMYFNLIPVNAAGLEGETKDIGIVDWLKCAWSPLIPEGNAGISADVYEELKSAMTSALNQAIPPDYMGFETTMRAIWKNAFWSIGPKDAAKITYYAQPIAGQDCTCPDGTGDPIVPSIWFTSVSDIQPETGTAWETAEVLDSGRRVHLTLAHVASTIGRSTGSAHLNLAGYAAGDDIKVRIYFGDGEDELYNDWFDTCPQPVSSWLSIGFNGVTKGDRVNDSNFYEVETANEGAQVLNFIDFVGGRWCPHYDGPFVRTNVYIEIVEINGVPLTPIGPV